MNTRYLSSRDWMEFQERFPAADAFLLRRSLLGELETLERLQVWEKFSPTQEARLIELKAWREGLKE